MAVSSHNSTTDTGVRIISMQLDGQFFAIEYDRHDWSKAIREVCRWKEQGLITADDQQDLARMILTRASMDGELKKLPVAAVKRRPVGVLQKLVAMLTGGGK